MMEPRCETSRKRLAQALATQLRAFDTHYPAGLGRQPQDHTFGFNGCLFELAVHTSEGWAAFVPIAGN